MRERMPGDVFRRMLRDQKVSGGAWMTGILAVTAYVVFLYPVIAEQIDLTELLEAMPEAIKSMMGGTIDFSTPNGFVRTELFSAMGPIIFIVYAVIHGTGTVAGEEERGTLALLLASPVSRRRVLAEKAAAVVAGIVAGAAVLWLGLTVSSVAAGVDLGIALAAQGCVSLALLGAFFGMLALAAGAATGRRGISSGVAVAVGVVTYLLNAFAPLVSWMEQARLVSPFHYYQGHDPLLRGLSPVHVVVLLAASAALFAYSLWAFERRDLTR